MQSAKAPSNVRQACPAAVASAPERCHLSHTTVQELKALMVTGKQFACIPAEYHTLDTMLSSILPIRASTNMQRRAVAARSLRMFWQLHLINHCRCTSCLSPP